MWVLKWLTSDSTIEILERHCLCKRTFSVNDSPSQIIKRIWGFSVFCISHIYTDEVIKIIRTQKEQ